MYIAEFVTEETLTEYERFVQACPKGHFMQSHRWSGVKSNWKWKAIIARAQNGEIAGSLALLIRKLPGMPYTMMYGCRGPVCDPHDGEVFKTLIEAAKKLAKTEKSYIMKLDPDIPASDTVFSAMLGSLGFVHTGKDKNFEGIQPRFVFRLNVENKTEDEILEAFESKTRYNLRLAQRKGVTVRVCGSEMLDEFTRLMNETGERDRFVVRDRQYFEQMLDSLGEHARLYISFFGNKAVSGALCIKYGDKVWYLYGASSNEYRNVMPNYLMQWEMIKWAIFSGSRIYDFRGVSGDLSEDNPLYGLYRFKKGFSGEFTEFVGEFDLIINPIVNFGVKHGTKAFKWIRYKVRMRKKPAADTEE